MLRCSVSMRWMTMVSSRRTRSMLFIDMVALFSSQRRDGVAQIGHEIADHFRDGAPIARRRRVFEVALQRFEAVCNHRHVETDPLGDLAERFDVLKRVVFHPLVFSENKNGPGLGWSRAVHPLLPRSRLFTSGVKRDAPRNPSGFFRLGLVSLRHSFDRNGRLFPPQINTRMAGGRPLGDGVLFTQLFRQAGFSKLKNTRKPCVMPFCSASVRSTPPPKQTCAVHLRMSAVGQ